MEQKEVGIWIRVSTDFQVDDESPEVHEERARYYCAAKGWRVAAVYRLDSISGKTVWELPETARMLEDVKHGRITGLVFSALARLGRNTRELLEFSEIFRSQEADLISLKEQIDTSTPAGRLFFTIIAAMAQWEREEISSRVAASVPIRANMGRPTGGQASYGYEWVDKQLQISAKEAPVRKLLYEIYLKCQRKKTTANKLNALGYRTRNGSKFSDATVERLLRDSTAKGIRRANYTKSTGNKKKWVYKSKEEWIEVPCPAIVDAELWEKCNAILDKQQRKQDKAGRRSQYLLAGIIKCECGQRMYINNFIGKFACSKCKNKVRNVDIMNVYENEIRKYLNDLNPRMLISEVDEQLKIKEAILDSTMKKRTQIRKKMDDLVELRLGGELNKDHFAKLYQPYEEQISQMEKSIPQLQGEIDFGRIQLNSADFILSEAKEIYLQWDGMDFQRKRGIVETITEYITIGKDTIDLGLLYLPSSTLQTSQRNFKGSSRPPA